MSAKSIYLVVYNFISFVLWAYITSKALLLLPPHSHSSLYPTILSPLTFTQSLAGLEVLHALLGLVRASPVTTFIQVGGKNLVVWTVMRAFPDIMQSDAGSWGFMGCVFAWGASEMVRYGFFVVQLVRGGETPGWVRWLRYSAFIVLYPPGLASEAWLVYLSLQRAEGISIFYRGYLFLGLVAYIPAGYFLYTHMLSQRRRVLKQ